jgi:uncharacterized membrane protein YdjX (TVP38/TMEM64 family)
MGVEDIKIKKMRLTIKHFLLPLIVLLMLGVIYYQIEKSGFTVVISDAEQLRNWVLEFGSTGPLIIMSLMAIAIVINPLPSAPIALVAGVLYGHTWGTAYIVIGATAGALVAFAVARMVGYEFLQRFLGKKISLGWFGSQNVLMSMVFFSRLMPFISFDLVSYGAGLTPIKLWRFFIATFAGLVPTSFLLAHFGGELDAGSLEQVLSVLLIMGLLTIVPVLLKTVFRNKTAKKIKPTSRVRYEENQRD